MHPSVISLGFAQMLAFALWFGADEHLISWAATQGHSALQQQLLAHACWVGMLAGALGLSLSQNMRQLAANPVIFLCYLIASCLTAMVLHPAVDFYTAVLLRLLSGACLSVATLYALDHAVRLSPQRVALALGWLLGLTLAGALSSIWVASLMPLGNSDALMVSVVCGLFAAAIATLSPLLPVERTAAKPPRWAALATTDSLRYLALSLSLSVAMIVVFIALLPSLCRALSLAPAVSQSPLLSLAPLLALALAALASGELVKHLRSSVLAKTSLSLAGWCALIAPQAIHSSPSMALLLMVVWAVALGVTLVPLTLLLMHATSLQWLRHWTQCFALGLGIGLVAMALIEQYVATLGSLVSVPLSLGAILAVYSIKWHMSAVARPQAAHGRH